jgi:hypothetical protein
VKGAATITITRNEMLCAFNQGDKFVLAIVSDMLTKASDD